MKNKQETNYEKRRLSDFKVFFVASGVILGIIAVIIATWSLSFSLDNSTLYGFQYETARKTSCSDRLPGSDETELCVFDNCEQYATKHVYTESLYTDLITNGMELLLNLPNKANFQHCTESFQYTEKTKHTVYDTNTYLVPQSDGRIKVETETDKYTIYLPDGGKKTVEYVRFEGHYCDEHSKVARTIWDQEVTDAFINHNLGYYFYEYGIWVPFLLVLIFELLAVLLLRLFIVIVPRKKVKIKPVSESIPD